MVSTIVDSKRGVSFDEDSLLVERFLAGDNASFEELYARYYERVYALAYGILLTHDETQDAVQEIFTLVYRNLYRFDRRSRFGTWLFRISVNRSIQEGRKRKYVKRTVPLTEALDKSSAPVEPESLDPRIEVALISLSPQDRAIIALFYWEELSLNEIADFLGCNVNAAKTRLYRARERFRTAYDEGEDFL